jgi:hypothetical protein
MVDGPYVAVVLAAGVLMLVGFGLALLYGG